VLLAFRPTYPVELQTLLDKNGYDIVMTEEELNGPERFAADHVLTDEQCQRLMKLANVSTDSGDNSLFSFLRQLTTWHCPHLLLCIVLRRHPILLFVQQSIDIFWHWAQIHAGEEDHALPGWTTSRRGQDSPWKSQSE